MFLPTKHAWKTIRYALDSDERTHRLCCILLVIFGLSAMLLILAAQVPISP